MGTILIKGVPFTIGEGYRIISEDQLRSRAKLASNSKWIDAVRRYGGKKLKVYGYDAANDRVWMSEDHSDTYKWKAFMLEKVYDKGGAENEAPSKFNPEADEPRTFETAVPKKSNKKLIKLLLLSQMLQASKEPAPVSEPADAGAKKSKG